MATSFFRFVTIHALDRRTDGWTEGRTDGQTDGQLSLGYYALALLQRVKMFYLLLSVKINHAHFISPHIKH